MGNNITLDDFFLELQSIAKDGASVVVKIDGIRKDYIYTIVISGGKLGESFFRKDGAEIFFLLQDAIDYYNHF